MMKKSPFMWVVWFITSFAAFHYLMVAFNWNLLSMAPIASIPRLPFIVMVVFGACGLISLITLFGECKECK